MATASNTPLAKRYFILILVLIGVIVSVALIAAFSRERIAANERAWFVAHLDALIPAALRDNDLYADAIMVSDAELLGTTPTLIYRARRSNTPVGAIIAATAPDGYGGPIELLIAVDYQGAVLGVDVLRHTETQGIGDGFAPHRSQWLQKLMGRSLSNPQPKQWTIRKDGGEFDQFTGASVTPRAILKAVRQALEYYALHRESIFNDAATQR
jgi:Na+-translocating ferredoxin:NAD+ oxidoreductase subunit G